MSWAISLIVLAILVVGVIMWKVTRKMAKTMLFVGFLLFLLFVVLGFVFILDLQKFQEKIIVENKVLILREGKTVLYGGVLTDFEKARKTKEIPFEPFSIAELRKEVGYLEEKEYDTVLGDNYKLILLDISFIEEGLNSGFRVHDIEGGEEEPNFSKQEILTILRLEEVDEYLQNAGYVGESAEHAKQVALWYGFLGSVENKGAEHLITEWKEGEVHIYEETTSLRVAKWVPIFVIRPILKGLQVTPEGEVRIS